MGYQYRNGDLNKTIYLAGVFYSGGEHPEHGELHYILYPHNDGGYYAVVWGDNGHEVGRTPPMGHVTDVHQSVERLLTVL